MTAVLAEVDALYAAVVLEPQQWSDQSVADWAGGVAGADGVDKVSAKYLRRIVRVAGKLQQFWLSDERASDPSLDWTSRVDIAMGPKAWRPVLDLATYMLESHPSPETFERVASMFRVVNSVEFLDGASFEEWRDGYQRN